MNEDEFQGRPGGLTGTARILTALAGLVTALTAVYFGMHGGGSAPGGPAPDPAPVVVNLTVPGSGVPDAPVDQGTVRASDAPADLAAAPGLGGGDAEQLIDACSQGDLDACQAILDTLAQECADGSGLSCDVLYEISAEGSAYETYGATCGGRMSADFADTCSQL